MRAIIDKVNLAKVIASHMTKHEQPELFIEWAERDGVAMKDVQKFATEAELQECFAKYNELTR